MAILDSRDVVSYILPESRAFQVEGVETTLRESPGSEIWDHIYAPYLLQYTQVETSYACSGRYSEAVAVTVRQSRAPQGSTCES